MPDVKARPRPAVDVQWQLPQLVDAAADLTRYILADNPERLRHSEAVAARAKLLTAAVDDDQASFPVAAAWLHDIGYAPGLIQTGFHPIDGARHLRATGWPPRIVRPCGPPLRKPVRRHRAAARRRDRRVRLPGGPHTDALTVADQTAGPNGRSMTVNERIRDMLDRHGPGSPNVRAHARREPYLVSAAQRVADRLDASGIGPAEHGIF